MRLSVLAVLIIAVALVDGAPPCLYGDQPGFWRSARWELESPPSSPLPTFKFGRLDNSTDVAWLPLAKYNEEAPWGMAWRAVDPRCQLSNEMSGKFMLPAGEHPPVEEEKMTILVLGDSNDLHMNDHVCVSYLKRHGWNSGWKARAEGPGGYSTFLRRPDLSQTNEIRSNARRPFSTTT